MFDTTLTNHLSQLSKLRFTQKEVERITGEMVDIVNLMDTISDFEMEENPKSTSPVTLAEIREDVADVSMDRSDILANAKEKGETFFKVPKVV